MYFNISVYVFAPSLSGLSFKKLALYTNTTFLSPKNDKVSQAFSISSKVDVYPSIFIKFKSKKSLSNTFFIMGSILDLINSSSKPQKTYPLAILFFLISDSNTSIVINFIFLS